MILWDRDKSPINASNAPNKSLKNYMEITHPMIKLGMSTECSDIDLDLYNFSDFLFNFKRIKKKSIKSLKLLQFYPL
jgi:hypothetical protein